MAELTDQCVDKEVVLSLVFLQASPLVSFFILITCISSVWLIRELRTSPSYENSYVKLPPIVTVKIGWSSKLCPKVQIYGTFREKDILSRCPVFLRNFCVGVFLFRKALWISSLLFFIVVVHCLCCVSVIFGARASFLSSYSKVFPRCLRICPTSPSPLAKKPSYPEP